MTTTIEPFDDVVIRDVLITGTVEVTTDDEGRRTAGEIERGLCLDVWDPRFPTPCDSFMRSDAAIRVVLEARWARAEGVVPFRRRAAA
ncbi:hypothetical protein ASG63_09000 [Methylobacterium sp. Leaf94]|uniref:hypothetical protein n=1 Tax=Methylobacterium sp. Leaf94 TaxID=1736250 RepID=UPI0006FED41C|nr:hypothetical protein [Methylobacterium sp. Leaf94]KQU17634.1 hypothetical protein ASG63_09000 [Methylobacterium sp. Leaf94]